MSGSVLKEGRYDRLTGMIVRDIWEKIKLSYGEEGEFFDTWSYEKAYKFPYPFSVSLTIVRDDNLDHAVSVGGSSNKDFIDIEIYILPEVEKKVYNHINLRLQDVIRHELEHILQWNRHPGQKRSYRLHIQRGANMRIYWRRLFGIPFYGRDALHNERAGKRLLRRML